MTDSTVTMTGNVVTEPRHVELDEGLHITSFRLACTPRRFDRTSREFVDGETSYYTVCSFRGLARNVAASVRRGEPVVVTGTLRVREWRNDDRSGTTTEIEALTVGHDLRRGVGGFERVSRARPVRPEDDAAVRAHLELDGEEPAADTADTVDGVDSVDTVTGEIGDGAAAGHVAAGRRRAKEDAA